MLGADLAEVGLVLELVKKLQVAVHAELLPDAPPGRRVDGLARPRMTAAAIGPETGPERLLWPALLQQDFAAWVREEHRKRPVKQTPTAMTFGLAGDTALAVVLVY